LTLTADLYFNMKINRRLFTEAKNAQAILLLTITLGFVGGVLTVLQARGVSLAISHVFLGGQGLTTVYRLLWGVFIIMLLRAGIVWGGEITAGVGARRIKQDLRHRLFSHILDIGPAYTRGEGGEANVRTGELINVATEGIEALEAFFSQYLPQIALAALVPLTVLIFVFPLDAISGIVLLVTAPLLPIFMYLIGSAAEALTQKQWRGLSRMSAYFLDVLQGLTTLKYLGRSREQIEVIKKVSEQYRRTTMSVLRVTFLSALALELIATLSTAVVAVEIGIRLLYGRLAFEQAFFVLLLAPEFYLPLRLLGTRFHAGMSGVEAAKRIYEILELPTANGSQVSSTGTRISTNNDKPPHISFKDIHFAYSGNRRALEGVTFEIQPGQRTALMGGSGAGKTTLTWLLLGFLQPQRGEILVDEIALQKISPSEWRSRLAWVPQNPYLFNDTILANIKLARPDASLDAIQQAARQAHADEFIQRLPQGYDTPVGERGARLSAGQTQRIALARAFLKDAPLLILDEATAHLDPETDALLQDSLNRLNQGRTVFVIAHHLSTIANADQVIRLERGRIIPTPADQYTIKAEINPASEQPSPVTHSVQPKIVDQPTGEHEHRRVDNRQRVGVRLLKLLAPFAGRVLLSTVLGFATIGSGIGLMTTAAYIISSAALHPSIADLQVAIVGVRFFGLSRGVFRYLERLVSHDVTFRLIARWRVWFYQALEPLAPARLMRYQSGDLLSRVISDIGSLENFYVRAVAPPLVAILVSVVTGAFIGGLSTQLAGVLILFLAIAGIGLPILTYLLSHPTGDEILRARAELSSLMVNGIQGMPDLLTCGQGEGQISQVKQADQQLGRAQARMTRVTAMQTALGGWLANMAMLTVLVLAMQRVTQGQLNGVFLGVLALATLTSFEAMPPLTLSSQYLQSSLAAARRLYELVDAPTPVVDPADPLIVPQEYELEVENLSFQYPLSENEDETAIPSPFKLEDISFSLPQGKHIAVVGPSGGGKTTLINLLLRFWDYEQGSIRLGGHELHQYRQDDIRKRIALVSQDTDLFSATLRDNLRIANPEASETDIIRAAQEAELHDFIRSLPDGYDTWVGEHGLRLSAGERQRVAIARALLKDAPLLILDEPTANLDPTTEIAVLDSIGKLAEGRSTVTIAHSLAGIQSMDEIFVMQEGRIIERGRHEELLTQRGEYWKLWELYRNIL
jgi:ATP-binding cassette, subfamily C, bacterial CydCD